MPKRNKKTEAEEPKVKGKKITFSEFNPCRPYAKGRHSERVFWVEELINAEGRNIKDIFEKAANNWARAMSKSVGELETEEYVDLYKSNIPGTLGDTRKMLDTLIPMIEKKFGKEFSYELDDDGDLTVEFTTAKKSKKADKAEAKPAAKSSKKPVKAAAKDEDEDEDEDSEDEDDEEDDED